MLGNHFLLSEDYLQLSKDIKEKLENLAINTNERLWCLVARVIR